MALTTGAVWLLALSLCSAEPADFCSIQVIDEVTGRGVPLVELETVNNIVYVTDSQGYVAFDEPGLLDQDVHFTIRSHGYEHPADGFGIRGKTVLAARGGSVQIPLKRTQIAERLYRQTGAGIYRDSILLKRPVPLRAPLLNAQVLGQDSVLNTIYQGKIYWFWGDTNRARYPLGNFQTTGATSELPGQGGLNPEQGVNFEYFRSPAGFVAEMCDIPGQGPTWLSGLIVVPDAQGTEKMYAAYAKIRPPLTVTERGLCAFNPQTNHFERVCIYPKDAQVYPFGHPWIEKSGDKNTIYYADPYPLVRVPAEGKRLEEPRNFEVYTCLEAGRGKDDWQVVRDAGGQVQFAWRKDVPFYNPTLQARLLKDGKLRPEEALLAWRDPETGQRVTAHGGSVAWNEFKKRWVMIAVEHFGTSLLGEVWYSEADTLVGPWVFARKIVTHHKYSFYNPKLHPMFTPADGKTLYFEGTYTRTFSGNEQSTPRYEYNQILYRLNLTDPRLNLPVPIYRQAERQRPFGPRKVDGPALPNDVYPQRPLFFAPEQAGQDLVTIHKVLEDPRTYLVAQSTPEVREGRGPALFAGLRITFNPPPPDTTLLYVMEHPQRGFDLILEDEPVPAGWRRNRIALCRVWKNPLSALGTPVSKFSPQGARRVSAGARE